MPRAAEEQPEHDASGVAVLDRPWRTLLWDDPVNVCEYVTTALVAVLHVDRERAEQLMLEAHNDGRAAVFTGTRTKAEQIAVALHGWHLQATLERVP